MQTESQIPTAAEQEQFAIRAYRGIEIGIGQDDPMADVSAQLEAQHPGHIVLVQVGNFLHGYDRTAHVLNTLKQYRLKLVNTAGAPHIRVGFPLGNFKKRLWSVVDQFQIPYVVYLGARAKGYTAYVSSGQSANVALLSAVTPTIVQEVIADLIGRGKVNQAAAKQQLANPHGSGFKLKMQAQELDDQLTQDMLAMSRDLRATFGTNVRECMARIMRNVFAYALAVDKLAVLRELSADVELIKHYFEQAPRLKNLRFSFEHRATLAVELGKLVGGLMRAKQVRP